MGVWSPRRPVRSRVHQYLAPAGLVRYSLPRQLWQHYCQAPAPCPPAGTH
jgi:hypothetical protein